MALNGLKVLSSILVGVTALTVSGPILGELAATMAPIYNHKAYLAVDDLGIPYEQVAFRNADGQILRGWFFQAETQDAPAILYAPATSHDQRSGVSLVAPLHQAGYHVLLFSYRGHGNSEGSRFGFTYGAAESEDVDAAVRFLSEYKGIKHIGAIGHSAGAVSIILSAARNPRIEAVVAASPFNSVEEVWETNRPGIFPKPLQSFSLRLSEFIKGYSRQQVRPEDVIGEISPRPVLLLHGSEDKRITEEQARRLFSAAKAPRQLWLVAGASHSQVRTPVMDELIGEIIEFLDGSLLERCAGDNLQLPDCS